MKRIDRQLVGILLVAAVLVFAAAYQWLGPGLITTDHPATSTEMAAQGVTLLTRTTYQFALFPLIVLAIVGFVLAMIPKRGETPVG